MKASARLNGSTLWKDEPQEGIDGRNPCGSDDSTNSSREEGPEGGHVELVSSLRGRRFGG